jgi:hypothetical protein
MNLSIIENDFNVWIKSLNIKLIDTTEIYILNLLISNFEKIALLGTAGGLRANLIGSLLAKAPDNLEQDLKLSCPELKVDNSNNIARRINKITVGPFRGFNTSEEFTFNKKYAFLYGPNGSGKSSFCEALEYSLLGSIQESNEKKIKLEKYIKNIHSGVSKKPITIGSDDTGDSITITENINAYRFSFIEKNRIDSFSRLTAGNRADQKSLISSLFGIDDFSNFVDGFTNEFDNRYIQTSNQERDAFEKKNINYVTDGINLDKK